MLWENGAYRLARCRFMTSSQFVQNAVSGKHSKTRYVYSSTASNKNKIASKIKGLRKNVICDVFAELKADC